MSRLTRAFMISLLGVCLSLPAWAQPVVITGPGPGRHFFISTAGGFPPLPPMIIPPLLMGMRAAHLTAHQQNQVSRILRTNGSQTAPLIQQLELVHEQIANKLLAPGKVSISELAPLEDRAAQLDAQIQQRALNASVKIRAILTPEQVARMAQFHRKMAALQAQMRTLMSETSQKPTAKPTP